MRRSYYDRLTDNRKGFLDQIYNLINTQFESQDRLYEELKKEFPINKDELEKELIYQLDNNSDYTQRIFIDSPWGTGKTHFCKALEEKILKYNNEKNYIEVIKINAWESDYFSEPMKSLIGEINVQKPFGKAITESAEKLITKFSYKILGKILKTALIKKLSFSNSDIEDIKSFFSGFNESELEEYKNYKKLVDDFKSNLSKDKDRKVILIDELDRCKPTYAIELLETVKHFFGVRNIIFIFLVNKEQMKGTISNITSVEDSCCEYFEKFYDICFRLPEIDYLSYVKIVHKKLYSYQSYKPYKSNSEVENSDDFDLIYGKLFYDTLEIVLKNYSERSTKQYKEKSPRNVEKAFQKYKLILSTIEVDERAIYPLIIFLACFVINEEFDLLEENINTITTLMERMSKKIHQNAFLQKLSSLRVEHIGEYKVLLEEVTLDGYRPIEKIEGKFIQFNKLWVSYNLLSDHSALLIFNKKVFNGINIEKYKDSNSSNLYSLKILMEWCKNKCEFLNYIHNEN